MGIHLPKIPSWNVFFSKVKKTAIFITRIPKKVYLRIVYAIYKQWYRLLVYGLFLGVLLLLPGQNIYEKQLLSATVININSLPFQIPPPAPYPINHQTFPLPLVTALGVMVVDFDSGVSMYEKNADTPLSPASTTKVMTALVTLDNFRPDDSISVKEISNESRTMGLSLGEQMSVEALLYGLLIHSANDAAFALSSAVPGGTEKFIQKMNEKANMLGMTNSHFTNPAGFDDPNHRMSVRDLSRLSLVALKNPLIAKVVSTRTITVSDTTYTRFHDLVTVNDLLGKIPGVAGLKTGYTKDSGECLVAYVIKPQGRFIVVILGSQDRFKETAQLISWILGNFTWSTPILATQSNRL